MLKKEKDKGRKDIGDCCSDRSVSVSGHCGDIAVTSNHFQIIYLQSLAVTLPTIFGARQYITIENQGPAAMGVWIDTMPNNSVQLGNGLAGPPIAGSQPDLAPAGPPTLVLQPHQSVTVAVTSIVLVRAMQGTARGCYVISWCCPMGLSLSISVPDRPGSEWLTTILPRGEGRAQAG